MEFSSIFCHFNPSAHKYVVNEIFPKYVNICHTLKEFSPNMITIIKSNKISCCREDKEKVNIVDHEDDDTVSFNLRNTWHFNQEESGRLTGDEIVTIPHVLLLVR